MGSGQADLLRTQSLYGEVELLDLELDPLDQLGRKASTGLLAVQRVRVSPPAGKRERFLHRWREGRKREESVCLCVCVTVWLCTVGWKARRGPARG
jgi:hypothetical protein